MSDRHTPWTKYKCDKCDGYYTQVTNCCYPEPKPQAAVGPKRFVWYTPNAYKKTFAQLTNLINQMGFEGKIEIHSSKDYDALAEKLNLAEHAAEAEAKYADELKEELAEAKAKYNFMVDSAQQNAKERDQALARCAELEKVWNGNSMLNETIESLEDQASKLGLSFDDLSRADIVASLIWYKEQLDETKIAEKDALLREFKKIMPIVEGAYWDVWSAGNFPGAGYNNKPQREASAIFGWRDSKTFQDWLENVKVKLKEHLGGSNGK